MFRVRRCFRNQQNSERNNDDSGPAGYRDSLAEEEFAQDRGQDISAGRHGENVSQVSPSEHPELGDHPHDQQCGTDEDIPICKQDAYVRRKGSRAKIRHPLHANTQEEIPERAGDDNERDKDSIG